MNIFPPEIIENIFKYLSFNKLIQLYEADFYQNNKLLKENFNNAIKYKKLKYKSSKFDNNQKLTDKFRPLLILLHRYKYYHIYLKTLFYENKFIDNFYLTINNFYILFSNIKKIKQPIKFIKIILKYQFNDSEYNWFPSIINHINELNCKDRLLLIEYLYNNHIDNKSIFNILKFYKTIILSLIRCSNYLEIIDLLFDLNSEIFYEKLTVGGYNFISLLFKDNNVLFKKNKQKIANLLYQIADIDKIKPLLTPYIWNKYF